MAKYRIHKTKDYTIMSNTHLKEKEMSLKAKGLLSVMLALPDEWNYSVEGLVSICKENETAIKSTLDEIKEFGYLTVTKLMPNETESGRIEYVYDIYEIPKQEGEKQGIENLPLEFLPLENQTQLNTNISNNTNINNSINKKENTKRKVVKAEYSTEFETVWKHYPRKVNKKLAKSSFEKARKDGVEYDTILNGVIKYAESCKNNNTPECYIAHGSTWFNARRWDDEYETNDNNLEGLNLGIML